MKDYIYDMIYLRNSLDKVWDELTEKYIDVLDDRISHAILKEQKEDEK